MPRCMWTHQGIATSSELGYCYMYTVKTEGVFSKPFRLWERVAGLQRYVDICFIYIYTHTWICFLNLPEHPDLFPGTAGRMPRDNGSGTLTPGAWHLVSAV